MVPDEVSRFDWVRHSPIAEAGCVTIVESVDVAAIVWAFGGSPADAEEAAELAGAFGDSRHPTMLLRRVGDRIIVVENNGFEGSRTEVLRRLPGPAVSAFWNVNAVTRFSYAVGGRVLTEFEALFPESRSGSEPEALAEQMAGLPWDSADPVSVMLALTARVTGFVVEPDQFAGPMMLVPLLRWPEDMPGQVSPRYESLTFDEPAVAYALLRADEESRWAAALAAVRVAAAFAGLADDPTLRAVVEVAAGAAEAMTLEELSRELKPLNRWPQFRAVEAARATLGTDALAAAYRAITEARYGVLAAVRDASTLRATVMAALGDPPTPAGSGSLTATPGDEPWHRYTWIGEHWLGWAAEVTIARGPGVGPADPDSPRGPVALERGSIWRRVVGEWTVFVGVGQIPRPVLPHLTELSGGGEVVHLQWSSRGQAWFWHVIDGDLRSTFEAYQPGLVRGSEPSELDELRAGLPFPLAGEDGGRQAPLLLALAERLTGLVLSPELLDAEWEAVPPPAEPSPPAPLTPTRGW